MIDVNKLTAEETHYLFIEVVQALTEEQLFEALNSVLTREQKQELAAGWMEGEGES